jgi:hypothetical protein
MRTMVLGVGAQKSATTWLFKQISKSTGFRAGLCKEYHLFDFLHLNGFVNVRNNIPRRIRNMFPHESSNLLRQSERKLLSFYKDQKSYFDYFDSILTSKDHFSSDITPSYAGLPSEVLIEIKNEFKRRNINLKVIFIMREPVTRTESSVKMEHRKNNGISEINAATMTKDMYHALSDELVKMRNNYAYTCQQIDMAFSPNEVFYAFYETLFSASEINRLSLFLNMQIDEFDTSHKVSSSKNLFNYRNEDMTNFKSLVEEQYQFVTERFKFDIALWNEATAQITSGTEA